MFAADSVILSDLADALKQDVGNLQSYWANIVQRCHTRAYGEIVSALLARGYSAAQIASWDDGASYERDMTLWYCAMSPQGQGVFDKESVGAWNVREQVATIILRVSGTFVDPIAGGPGTVGYGLGNVSNDIFTGPWSGEETGEIPCRW